MMGEQQEVGRGRVAAGEGATHHEPGPVDSDPRRSLGELLSHPGVVNRATARAVVVLVAFTVVLFGPEDDLRFLAQVVGAALVVVAAMDLFWRVRTETRVWIIEPMAALLAGVLLVFWPDISTNVVGRILGIWLIAYGVVHLLRALLGRRQHTDDVAWLLAKGALALIAGLVPILWPVLAAEALVIIVSVAWVLAGVVAVYYGAPKAVVGRQMDPDPAETTRILVLWLRERELNDADRARLNAKLFFEGAEFRARLARFTVLLLLSVLIASLGILTDSTAVVIGAMLIAPLMTPIMATTAALVSGWPRRAWVSGRIVLGGTVGAIAFAYIAARFLPVIGDLSSNGQVASRVNPTFLDLLIALAAGAAGAFALAREDVADSLPGVAIAVALVPPLSVVGITLQAGDLGDATGALLLFTTNLVAIMLAGGVVLVLAGFTPVSRLESEKSRVKAHVATLLAGTIIIMIPLVISGNTIASSVTDQDQAHEAVNAWLVDRDDALVVRVEVTGDAIEVVVVGQGDPPPPELLADGLAEEIGSTVTLDLRWIPETRIVLDGLPDAP